MSGSYNGLFSLFSCKDGKVDSVEASVDYVSGLSGKHLYATEELINEGESSALTTAEAQVQPAFVSPRNKLMRKVPSVGDARGHVREQIHVRLGVLHPALLRHLFVFPLLFHFSEARNRQCERRRPCRANATHSTHPCKPGRERILCRMWTCVVHISLLRPHILSPSTLNFRLEPRRSKNKPEKERER